MKIVIIGTRGIPLIPGGIETHCEEIYPRIVAMGHDVTVIRRKCYVTPANDISVYKGVKLQDAYAPRDKRFETIIHTFLSLIQAKRLKPDLVHIHAIGPALLVPFARLLGMKVVTTNHGPDYDRNKWGKVAKIVLKAGERMGARFSNRVIVISSTIANILKDKYGRCDTDLILNGVNRPVKSRRTDYIESLGLTPHKYILTVGRFVPEKGLDDLIKAYKSLGETDYKLVLAGDADHEDDYSRTLKKRAREAGVALTGYIKGEKLNQLFSNAAIFALPSYHEGLPIALLEAMSYDLDIVLSDISANRLKELSAADFFPPGDVEALAKRLKEKISNPKINREYDLSSYDWNKIAEQTVNVYKEVVT